MKALRLGAFEQVPVFLGVSAVAAALYDTNQQSRSSAVRKGQALAKVHGPSFARATLLYVAAAGVWMWAQTPSGRAGQPPYSALALLVVAMVAGPVALINLWNILWGSFKYERSVPVFMLEFIYSCIVPGLLFSWHLLRFIR